jgi:hypothetical protein
MTVRSKQLVIITFTPELFKLRYTFLMLLFLKAYLTRRFLKHTVIVINKIVYPQAVDNCFNGTLLEALINLPFVLACF